MPLSEESDPFARRNFAGSSGGETVPPWNGASGTRAGCPVRVDQGSHCPAARPDQHREGPAPPRSAAETKKPERTACAARPGFSSARCPPRSAPPPPRSAPGRTAPPTVTACPTCPAWAVTACPITCPGCSFQPDPAAALMTPPPCCPHPCQTYRQRQPPARQHPAAGPTPAQRQRGQILHLTGYGFRLRA